MTLVDEAGLKAVTPETPCQACHRMLTLAHMQNILIRVLAVAALILGVPFWFGYERPS